MLVVSQLTTNDSSGSKRFFRLRAAVALEVDARLASSESDASVGWKRSGARGAMRPHYLRVIAAFSSTGFGSANCNQKPIISSSLGSPQRMALEGSGFCALSNEVV